MEGAEASDHEGDKYRSHLYGEGEINTQWRFGAPPKYDLVNNLFEQGRTKEWPKGSLEETVQNAIKTWEMELSHKTRIQDFKTINPDKFRFLINGRKGLTGEETLELGSYNALLQSSLPEELQSYRADHETFESSHEVFHTAFPRGFAWEVLKVYSGPPEITFKFRHWGYMEGPYKGHAPTGEMVELTGVAILKVVAFVLEAFFAEMELETPGGSEENKLDGNNQEMYAEEEASGTRLLIDGRTCLLQNEHNSSKLVAETPCKLLRFLVQDGSHVNTGAPYAKVEVMKMCIRFSCLLLKTKLCRF